MGGQEDIIRQLESKAEEERLAQQGIVQQPVIQQPVYQEAPSQQINQNYPQNSPTENPASVKPVKKKNFVDIIMLISYILLGIVGTIIAILLIYSAF